MRGPQISQVAGCSSQVVSGRAQALGYKYQAFATVTCHQMQLAGGTTCPCKCETEWRHGDGLSYANNGSYSGAEAISVACSAVSIGLKFAHASRIAGSTCTSPAVHSPMISCESAKSTAGWIVPTALAPIIQIFRHNAKSEGRPLGFRSLTTSLSGRTPIGARRFIHRICL